MDTMSSKLVKLKKRLESKARGLSETHDSFWTVIARNDNVIKYNSILEDDYGDGMECYGEVIGDLQDLDDGVSDLELFIHPTEIRDWDMWWYDYVVNQSPFKDVFLTKDPESHMIQINLERPYTEILAALIFHRRIREVIGTHNLFTMTPPEFFMLSEICWPGYEGRLYFYDFGARYDHHLFNGDTMEYLPHFSKIPAICVDGFQKKRHWWNRGVNSYMGEALKSYGKTSFKKELKNFMSLYTTAKQNKWGEDDIFLLPTEDNINNLKTFIKKWS
jgi:hypothetical protein